MSNKALKRMPIDVRTEVEGEVLKEAGRNFTIQVPGEKKPLIWSNAFYDAHKGLWWGMVNENTLCWWKGKAAPSQKLSVPFPTLPGRGALGS